MIGLTDVGKPGCFTCSQQNSECHEVKLQETTWMFPHVPHFSSWVLDGKLAKSRAWSHFKTNVAPRTWLCGCPLAQRDNTAAAGIAKSRQQHDSNKGTGADGRLIVERDRFQVGKSIIVNKRVSFHIHQWIIVHHLCWRRERAADKIGKGLAGTTVAHMMLKVTLNMHLAQRTAGRGHAHGEAEYFRFKNNFVEKQKYDSGKSG